MNSIKATPLTNPGDATLGFTLISVILHAEGHADVPVPLPAPHTAPFDMKEGAEIRIELSFRLRRAVEGLRFVDVRKRQGVVVGTSETVLGSYRPGGPYSVVLPPERLPTGHLARDTYTVTGTFFDAHGTILGDETHYFRITKDW